MKKAILVTILIGALVTACNSGNQPATPSTQDNVVVIQPMQVDPTATIGAPTATIEIVEPLVTNVTCTAVSEEKIELVQDGDWVTGAVEGYSVTLIEYGDYQ